MAAKIVNISGKFFAYDSSVNGIGQEFAAKYVSRFHAVATAQLHEIGRSSKARRAGMSGFGHTGLAFYDSSVDGIGKHFAFTYASRFCAVARLQLRKIARG